MQLQRARFPLVLSFAALFGVTLVLPAQQGGGDKKPEQKKEKKKARPNPVYTDRDDPKLPADFKYQGEWVGNVNGAEIGCQIIALGDGYLQAVLLPGGLPGRGWDGKNKSLMDGKIEGDKATFRPATGKRKYMANEPLEFSATAKFPPIGQKSYSAVIAGDKMSLKGEDGQACELHMIMRKSPTLGMKPPSGAVVLFDGSSASEWNRGRVDTKNGILNTDGGDIVTKRRFNNYTAHVEFMLPYRPYAREQGRANSGFYQVDMYEVQILDSFGLEGKNNECGGIYSQVAPKINACLPPLRWQTYDVEFTNGSGEGTGKARKMTAKSRLTVRLNGIVIHDNIAIPGPTGGARNEDEGTPGPLRLQGHGNPLQFRNVWVVEKQ